jgi:uncharacterized Zn-binding protein involved in type VI secretion
MDAQADQALRDFQLLTGQREPEEGEAKPDGALAKVGATFGLLTSLEQLISAPLAMIPFPAFPAIRVTDMDVGLPHAHSHPPNLVPPAPPVPFPSTGPVIPIPFLSGATRTLINGMPAARCGDMGLGIWCGGYFPMYEVFLGSSSVWVEGQRAGRLLVDITRHCIFSAPKPSDPPLGPMVGMTISSSPNVLIGGVPMPSLLDLAMGAAMQGLMRGFSKALKKLKAMRKGGRQMDDLTDFAGSSWSNPNKASRPTPNELFDQLVESKFVKGDDLKARHIDAYRILTEAEVMVDRLIGNRNIVLDITDPDVLKLVRQDLVHVACNPVGKHTLERIAKSNHQTKLTAGPGQRGGAKPDSKHAYWDVPNRQAGAGSGTDVRYDPWVNEADHFPPDSVLHHELVHAANNAEGRNLSRRADVIETVNGKQQYQPVPAEPDPTLANSGLTPAEQADATKAQWSNLEEQTVIKAEDNGYREMYNMPLRNGHDFSVLPPPGGAP